MKRFLLLLTLLAAIIGCKKEEITEKTIDINDYSEGVTKQSLALPDTEDGCYYVHETNSLVIPAKEGYWTAKLDDDNIWIVRSEKINLLTFYYDKKNLKTIYSIGGKPIKVKAPEVMQEYELLHNTHMYEISIIKTTSPSYKNDIITVPLEPYHDVVYHVSNGETDYNVYVNSRLSKNTDPNDPQRAAKTTTSFEEINRHIFGHIIILQTEKCYSTIEPISVLNDYTVFQKIQNDNEQMKAFVYDVYLSH